MVVIMVVYKLPFTAGRTVPEVKSIVVRELDEVEDANRNCMAHEL